MQSNIASARKEPNFPNSLLDAWRQAGIHTGDCVLLHSSLLRLFTLYRRQGVSLSVSQVLNSFLAAVGSEGSLLLPCFNFAFARGEPFDIRHTRSEMGALTEEARLHHAAIRTHHPIYSFAVIGPLAERFAELNNIDSFGPDSPFGLLRELNGKIAVLGLPDQGSMTSYHHVEHMADVDYRYHKTFSGEYFDAQGQQETRSYRMHVRDIARGVTTAVEPMGELLWTRGVYSGERFDQGHGLRVTLAQHFYEETMKEIRAGHAEGLLYTLQPEKMHT